MSKARQLADLGNVYSDGALSNRNLIINGAMEIAQRGTSSTSDSYRTVDRFRNNVGGPSVTQTQETLTSGDPYDLGFRYFYRQTNTSASSATSSNMQIFQHIESQTIASSGWNYTSPSSYITCSFWVRSSLAGTYNVCFRSLDTTSQWYASEFTIAANTWTKIVKKVFGNSNLVFNNDAGQGLQVNIVAHWGTNFTDSGFVFDQWAAYDGSSRSQDYSQDWGNTASATFDVTGVQLEVGDTATPFEHRSYGDELARCQRYYWQTWPIGTSTSTDITGDDDFGVCMAGNSSKIVSGGATYPVTMRARPSVSVRSASGTALKYYERHTDTDFNFSSAAIHPGTSSILLHEYDGSAAAGREGSVHIFCDAEL